MKVRKGVYKLLLDLYMIHDLAIYTAATKKYADIIVDYLEFRCGNK